MDRNARPGSLEQDGPRRMRRDALMATALRQLHARLQASTSTVYLVDDETRVLVAAMSVDTPLSFTVVPEMAVDDPGHISSRAYRSGGLFVADEKYVHELIQENPALVLRLPFPVLGVSAALRTARRRIGVVTMRWLAPRRVARKEMDFIAAAADRLALDLEALAEQGTSMQAPDVPLFIAGSVGGSAAERAERGEAEQTSPHGHEATGSTFLYQLLQLATELTAATSTQDVMASTRTRLVRPFGGRAVMLCTCEAGRLSVAGSAGFPNAAVRRVDGIALSRSTPMTDAITQIEARFPGETESARSSYPDMEWDDAIDSQAFLPLISNNRAVGCCILEFGEVRRLTHDERAVLMVMVGQVGQVLERARAYELMRARAQGLQQSLLPRRLPLLPETELAARYVAATEGAEVGGDWYDVIPLPDGGIGLVIGDVEGHTLESAAIMGQVRTAVRAYAAEGHDPSSVLDRVNHLLARLDSDLLVTCCCMWVDLGGGIAVVASAGHHVPVVADVGGRLAAPAVPVGPPFGVDDSVHYQQTDFALPPGAVTALFTDGLLNARHGGTEPAVDRLAHRITDGYSDDLEVVADRLIADFRPEADFEDDVALLLMRYVGARQREHRRVAQFCVQRHDLRGVRRIRHQLGDLLYEWDLEAPLDELKLLVSEVVTNALIHADSEVYVQLREYPDHIRIEVRDTDPHPPMPTWILVADEAENQEAESGRGLLIVDAVASAWGSAPAGRGKTTWFELPTRALVGTGAGDSEA
jgi:anti-sigma regulatory factor (Ser/Thr protein kinase)/GAF domain-containing protein